MMLFYRFIGTCQKNIHTNEERDGALMNAKLYEDEKK